MFLLTRQCWPLTKWIPSEPAWRGVRLTNWLPRAVVWACACNTAESSIPKIRNNHVNKQGAAGQRSRHSSLKISYALHPESIHSSYVFLISQGALTRLLLLLMASQLVVEKRSRWDTPFLRCHLRIYAPLTSHSLAAHTFRSPFTLTRFHTQEWLNTPGTPPKARYSIIRMTWPLNLLKFDPRSRPKTTQQHHTLNYSFIVKMNKIIPIKIYWLFKGLFWSSNILNWLGKPPNKFFTLFGLPYALGYELCV